MKSGKYTLGHKSTLKQLRSGKAKLILPPLESFSEEEDDFVPNYIAKTLVLGIRGTTKNKKTGVVVPNAKIVEIRTELEDTEASNLDSLEGFNGTPSPPRAPGQRGASGGD